jgi:hypothetical protein
VLDISMQAISGMTGWPIDLLEQGIAQLMEPDAKSRTPDHDGRRLVLLEAGRPWGWRAVNHSKYREKARKQNYDEKRTDSGQDAERKRKERESRDVPTRPDASRSHTQTQEEDARAREPVPEGLDIESWNRWEIYRRKSRKPIKPESVLAAQRKLAGFGSEQAAAVEHSIANGYTGIWAPKDRPKQDQRRRADGLVV